MSIHLYQYFFKSLQTFPKVLKNFQNKTRLLNFPLNSSFVPNNLPSKFQILQWTKTIKTRPSPIQLSPPFLSFHQFCRNSFPNSYRGDGIDQNPVYLDWSQTSPPYSHPCGDVLRDRGTRIIACSMITTLSTRRFEARDVIQGRR